MMWALVAIAFVTVVGPSEGTHGLSPIQLKICVDTNDMALSEAWAEDAHGAFENGEVEQACQSIDSAIELEESIEKRFEECGQLALSIGAKGTIRWMKKSRSVYQCDSN
jgi:hypothetical protein